MSATHLPRTLRVVLAGEVFTAALNPDAPLTVAAFMKLLPYRQKMIHVRWRAKPAGYLWASSNSASAS